jgi:NADPH-dependent 2,4-dienoyl-CoA reductase/sulfur reductase-like enzyme
MANAMAERLLIVGGVAAGTKAAATAHRRNPKAQVVLLQEEAEISYSACGMPYHLADAQRIPRSKLIARTPQAFMDDGIHLRTGMRVLSVDAATRRVRVLDLGNGKEHDEPFDQLLLATGAQARRLNVPVSDSAPPVYYLRTLVDADALRPVLLAGRRIVVLGGGYIGMEMAETCASLGMHVTLVEMQPRLLPGFAAALAEAVEKTLHANGVTVHTASQVTGLDAGHVLLKGGGRVPADMVLAAIGVQPNTALAQSAAVALGRTGAIAVNSRMQTNVPGVYAAGDCAESPHRISGQACWLPLGDVANRHGRVAGTNMAGGDAHFPGVLGTAIFKVFDLAVARTGLGQEEAKLAGFDAVSAQIQAPSRARYMSGSATLMLSVTAERGTGRLLGAQAVGTDAVDKTIDTFAAALWGGLATTDLPDLDLAYAPPFSPVLSPVQVAGEVLNKLI